jgi:hypothetical protein
MKEVERISRRAGILAKQKEYLFPPTMTYYSELLDGGAGGHLGNVLRMRTCSRTEVDNAMRLLDLSFSQLA